MTVNFCSGSQFYRNIRQLILRRICPDVVSFHRVQCYESEEISSMLMNQIDPHEIDASIFPSMTWTCIIKMKRVYIYSEGAEPQHYTRHDLDDPLHHEASERPYSTS